MQTINTELRDGRQAVSNTCRPQRYGLLTAILILAVLFTLTMSGWPAFAADDLDQLYLTGVIKSVSPGTGFVTVDVKSSACHGMRIFKADNPGKLESYLDQRVSFFIDSSVCSAKETYTIVTARGLRK